MEDLYIEIEVIPYFPLEKGRSIEVIKCNQGDYEFVCCYHEYKCVRKFTIPYKEMQLRSEYLEFQMKRKILVINEILQGFSWITDTLYNKTTGVKNIMRDCNKQVNRLNKVNFPSESQTTELLTIKSIVDNLKTVLCQ